jgi:hypothetical protein
VCLKKPGKGLFYSLFNVNLDGAKLGKRFLNFRGDALHECDKFCQSKKMKSGAEIFS